MPRKKQERSLKKLITSDFGEEGISKAFQNYIQQTSLKTQPHNASLCSKCGKCEVHRPQNIAIRTELDNVVKNLEGFIYKPARLIMKLFFKA